LRLYNTNTMRANKLFKRPKAENGAGRSVKIKHLLLPEEVVEDLKLYKLCYEICLATKKDKDGNPVTVRVTYEQMLRRWMDNVGRLDSDVEKCFRKIKEDRRKEQERMAAGLGQTSEEYRENQASFDPADPELEPWKLGYTFERDGEEIEAYPGDRSPFFAKIDGRYVGMKEMLAGDWTLINSAGAELDIDQAWQVNKLIKEHQD
jgi:hypothetical protein